MTDGIAEFLSSGHEYSPATPTVLLLHGYGASEQSLAGLADALAAGNRWWSPRGPLPVSSHGYAWAPITTPGDPDPAHIAAATATLWEWIDVTFGRQTPLIAVGFSQGGLMASQLLRTRPQRLAGTAILAGFTVNAAQPGDADLAAQRPAVLYCRGDADTVITPQAKRRTEGWLADHVAVEFHEYPGLGHTIDPRMAADVAAYVRRAAAAAADRSGA